MGVTYLPVMYHINWCTNVHVQTTKHDINDTDNKQVYTAQVQVIIPTVPMQQVCPERVQNTSDKQ